MDEAAARRPNSEPVGAGRSREDLEALFAVEWRGVVRYLRRATRHEDLAEDLAQDTFLRAAQALDGFRGEASPRTWLRRIAANVLRDHWRSRAARAARLPGPWPPQDDLQLADPGASPALAMERRQVQTCLEDLVAQLPAGEGAALILAVGHSIPPREIARILGVAPEAARARLHRARSKLAAVVVERCVLVADEGGALSCEARGSAVPSAPCPPNPTAPA